MNAFLKTTAISGLLLMGMTACKKDETRVKAEFGPAPVLTASTASVGILSLANAAAPAIAFTWTAHTLTSISEGAKPASPAAYTLQLDKASGDFSSARQFNAGTAAAGSISRTLTTSELNTALLDLMLPFGTSAQVKVRLRTVVAENQPVLFSEAKTFTVTPYNACVAPGNIDWGIVGPAADGWPASLPTPPSDRNMPYVCGGVNAFILRTPLTAAAFKFRANRDWGTNLGGGPFTIGTPITLTPNGPDLIIPAADAGTYNVKLVVTLNSAGVATGGTLTVTP